MGNTQVSIEASHGRQPYESAGEVMSWPRTLWMYLSPGILVMILYLFGGRWLQHHHQPADLALAAGFALFALPVELGRALRAAHRATGRWTLTGGVDFRAATSRPRFLGRALLLTVVAFGLLLLTLPLTSALEAGPFHFLPNFLSSDYNWTKVPQARGWLLAVGGILLLINGLVMPWVEEVYYRGYLLSRTPGRRSVAILVGAALFAVEHLWQPQNWPLIAGLAIVLGLAAYRWRTIWVGYVVHAFANSFGIIVLILPLVRR